MVPAKQVIIPICITILVFSLFCIAREEVWTEVKSPNFIIISDDSAKAAKKTAQSFEQFRSLLQTVLKLKADPPSPLVVFAVRNKKSREALYPLKYLEKGAIKPAGIFMSSPEKNCIRNA